MPHSHLLGPPLNVGSVRDRVHSGHLRMKVVAAWALLRHGCGGGQQVEHTGPCCQWTEVFRSGMSGEGKKWVWQSMWGDGLGVWALSDDQVEQGREDRICQDKGFGFLGLPSPLSRKDKT